MFWLPPRLWQKEKRRIWKGEVQYSTRRENNVPKKPDRDHSRNTVPKEHRINASKFPHSRVSAGLLLRCYVAIAQELKSSTLCTVAACSTEPGGMEGKGGVLISCLP